jgi:stearoyl-CoA desaturase (delta-9 desaturase)
MVIRIAQIDDAGDEEIDDLDPVAEAATAPGMRLPTPAGVDLTRIHPGYIGTFLLVHAAATLACLPWLFSWIGVASLFAGIVLFGQFAITIGYHRLLSHHSFHAPKWLERSLATLAMCAGQETPARWVAWHRLHHLHSDHREDPHTPLVSFLWAHVNWLVYEKRDHMQTFALFDRYARDILRDPYYFWIEKIPLASCVFFVAHAVVIGLVGGAAFLAAYGPTAEALRLTLSLLVWGVALRTVAVWHITWSVNSLTHLFGYRNFDTPDGSRNNWLVTILTSGEGWHNNHHADPASASMQVRWWEFDLNYRIIQGLARLGIVTNVVPPRHVRDRLREEAALKLRAARAIEIPLSKAA